MSDLSAPLTRRKARRLKAAADAPRRHWPVARIAAGLVVLLAAGLVARVVLVDDPEGGRPATTVDIASASSINPVAGANSNFVPTAAPSIVADPEPAAEAAPTDEDVAIVGDPAAVLPELAEQTEFGPIPRISSTGVRPFDAYARPSDTPATADGKALVAIVVSGLGLNLDGTLEAISKLPDEVTLAFAPYGKSLDRTVEAARIEGHEIFLEVPLEPFDYPDNDPGPDTLLTGQAPRDNLDKLFFVMSRLSGYAGVINNMGARFTASGADFAPVMEELGARGLGYLDDGSSNRSLALQLSQANRVPFNRVDIVLDANPARGPILEQLQLLVDKAKKDGYATGMIAALPVSVETIAEWARDLDGVEIVPASALMKD